MDEIKAARPAGLGMLASEGTPPVRLPSWFSPPISLARSRLVAPSETSIGAGGASSELEPSAAAAAGPVRDRFAAESVEDVELRVRVGTFGFVELEAEGSIEPKRSINCSRLPAMGKLFCANRRRKTSFVSVENSIIADKKLAVSI